VERGAWQLREARRQLAGNFANYSKRPCRQDEGNCATRNRTPAERQVMAQVAIYQLNLCLTTRTPKDSHQKKNKLGL